MALSTKGPSEEPAKTPGLSIAWYVALRRSKHLLTATQCYALCSEPSFHDCDVGQYGPLKIGSEI
jgi:hypothetical protein